MSTAGASTRTLPSHCEFVFDTQRYSKNIAINFCISAPLPYISYVNLVMDQDGQAVSSEKEPGMSLTGVGLIKLYVLFLHHHLSETDIQEIYEIHIR